MEVERIRNLEDLDKKREEWNEFLFQTPKNCIFLTYEWFSSWWKCFSENNSLEILIFKDENNSMAGIAPLMLKEGSLHFIASREVSDYCDFIHAKEKQGEFYENLLEYLAKHYSGIDKIELINIKYPSPTITFLPQLASTYKFTLKSFEAGVAPFLSLPSTYESYLALLGRKSRHELRRKLKRIESLTNVKTLRITDTQELEMYIEEFISLHQKSSASKANFWGKKGMTEFFREFVYRFSLKRWVELNFLLYQDKIIASLLNFSYFNRLYFYNSAYDREYSSLSPGFFLFHHCLKQAIIEGNEKADFLRGEEKYKYDFGAGEDKIFKVLLSFKPS